MTISDLRDKRLAVGLTQKRAAHLMAIPARRLNEYELGHRPPKPGFLPRYKETIADWRRRIESAGLASCFFDPKNLDD